MSCRRLSGQQWTAGSNIIRIEKLYKEFPDEVYLMDTQTGRSGVINSFRTKEMALKEVRKIKRHISRYTV